MGFRTRLWTTPAVFLVFLGGTMLLISTAFFRVPESIASTTWPTTQGVVVTSEVREVWFYQEGLTLCPMISYRYVVRGLEYESNDVEVFDTCNGMMKVIKQYPVGKRVRVYYQASNPALAVLEPGIPFNDGLVTWLIIVITEAGVVFFLGGLLGLLGLVKPPSTKKVAKNIDHFN